MNLRHIDEFLEKHSVGWHPLQGDFRISKSTFRRNPLDVLFGGESEEERERSARAAAEAAVKQAEFEASRRAGLEKLMLKRRRGFGASMIVQPTLGSTMTLGS